MSITFRAGKLDPDPSKPRLRLSQFARPAAVQVPDEVDWATPVDAPDEWPMYGNDRYGDCVFAGQGHETLARTTLAGRAFVPSEDEVLGQYHDATGFDPSDPSTDQGAVIQDALNYWRKYGFPAAAADHQDKRIAAFAEVDHNDPDELLTALYLFGSASIGLQVPDYAMDQFNQGQMWDVQSGGRNLGGHAVHLARAWRNGSGLRLWVVTWGRLQEVTWGFWRTYVDEAWVSITEEWIGGGGQSPSGLDLAALAEQFTAITGEPAPFPTPPSPQPVPVPPSPAVTPNAADLKLWGQVHRWVQHPHLMPGSHTVAQHLRDWAASNGLK